MRQLLVKITRALTITTVAGGVNTGDTLVLKGSVADALPRIYIHGANGVMTEVPAGKVVHYREDGTDFITFKHISGVGHIYGPDSTGQDLEIHPNYTDAYPKIKLNGAGYLLIYYPATKGLWLYNEAANTHKLGGENSGGYMSVKESTAAPTPTGSFGAIYTKSDNKLYFQDGAGAEHEVAFV